jgi:DNA-binding PadR family transcriptional regulator
MIRKGYQLMSLKYGLLGLLNYSSKTGYELDKIFKGSLDFFWQAQTSQVYRELNSMERQGLLTSNMEYQQSKPNKKVYSITQEGKAALNHWLAEDDLSDSMMIRFGFLVKLFFSAGRCHLENIDTLKKFQTECRKVLETLLEYEFDSSDGAEQRIDSLYWDMTADFGQGYYQMCIQWADNCIKKLETKL